MPHLTGEGTKEPSDPRLRKAFRLGVRDAAIGYRESDAVGMAKTLEFDADEVQAYYDGHVAQTEENIRRRLEDSK